MRKILFRGKRTDDGEWVEGNLLYDVDSEQAQIFYFEYLYSECGLERAECAEIVDPSTVGQYTGLTDKNCKKIFEGDIITAYFKSNRSKQKFSVIFENGTFLFDNSRVKVSINNIYRLKIIGNIYDNPELLKGAEQ